MKLRAGNAVAALAVAALAAGCGTDDAVAPGEATATPEAVGAKLPAAEPKVLEVPRDGNPIVWVRKGAKVDIYDRPGGEVIETVDSETEFGSRMVFAVHSQRGDWAAVPTAFVENGEPLWLRLDAKRLRAGSVGWEIEIDLSEYRADLIFEGERTRSFGVSIGTPGSPTPTGRFAVTDTFRGDLNPAYGCCAVALTARQADLPSGWLGGDRIAIHGGSSTVGAQVSSGCVRALDSDVSDLVDRVPPGTPVTIRP